MACDPGPWLATPGRFFRSWGRHVTEAELASAATEEAAAAPEGAAAGWCKIIGDWTWDEPPVPLAVLRDVTSAVHAIGGKVAVHCQTAARCANTVAAGVDSLEHGLHLDRGLLHQTVAQGTALVPTLNAFAASAFRFRVRSGTPSWPAGRPCRRGGGRARGGGHGPGRDRHASLREVAEEVERLISAGLSCAAAVGAANWTARTWLGLPGLTDGAPADLVIYDEEPVTHPDILHHPRLIILRGQILA